MGIYERIQEKVDEKGISIKKLEKEVGLGNGVIKKWSTGSPQCNKLLSVANYLQVSLDWLVTGKIKNELTKNEIEMLEYFKILPEREQIKMIGVLEEKAKEQKNKLEKSSEYKTG